MTGKRTADSGAASGGSKRLREQPDLDGTDHAGAMQELEPLVAEVDVPPGHGAEPVLEAQLPPAPQLMSSQLTGPGLGVDASAASTSAGSGAVLVATGGLPPPMNAAAVASTGGAATAPREYSAHLAEADSILAAMNEAVFEPVPLDNEVKVLDVDPSELEEAEVNHHISELLSSEPCCEHKCLQMIDNDLVREMLRDYVKKPVSKRERDVYLMCCIRSRRTQQRNRFEIPILGTPHAVCRAAFCKLFDISSWKFSALRDYTEEGLLFPPKHGNAGTPSNHRLAPIQRARVVEFMRRLAAVQSEAHPASGDGGVDPGSKLVMLKSNLSGSAIYERLYKVWIVQQNPGEDGNGSQPVSYGSFFAIWHNDERCNYIRVK